MNRSHFSIQLGRFRLIPNLCWQDKNQLLNHDKVSYETEACQAKNTCSCNTEQFSDRMPMRHRGTYLHVHARTNECSTMYVEALYGGLVRRTNRERQTPMPCSVHNNNVLCQYLIVISLSFLSISLVLKSFQSDYLLGFFGWRIKMCFCKLRLLF